jgi:SSS family solute:Na+ symporter
VNARGAMASLMTGFVLGMARLVAELNKSSLDGLLYTFADINFLHFAIFLFVICTAVLIGASFTAPAPSHAKLAGLTFATPGHATTSSTGADSNPAWRRKDAILSVILTVLVGLIWIYFSG